MQVVLDRHALRSGAHMLVAGVASQPGRLGDPWICLWNAVFDEAHKSSFDYKKETFSNSNCCDHA